MSEKQQLLRMLFDTPGRELVNLKLCVNGGDVSEASLCTDVIAAITKIEAGTAKSRDEFGDRNAKKVNMKAFIASRRTV